MIYFDHHAATPLLPQVLAEMERVRPFAWANPSSVHAAGRRAKAELELARRRVGEALGADPRDIVFTSGGTESVNLAFFGAIAGAPGHLITTNVEHPSMAACVRAAEAQGWQVTALSALRGVAPTPSEFAAALRPDTRVVAMQWVNHETGTVFPIEAYARIAAERNVTLVLDAAQTFGKLPIDAATLGRAFIAVTGQKIGAPSGIGAVLVPRGIDFDPVLRGGSQERGRRPGTPDVVSAAGLGMAASLVPARVASFGASTVTARLEQALVSSGAVVNGADGERVHSVLNVSFEGVRGDMLVPALDVEGLCVSSGAACSSGVSEGSPILRAMYPDEAWRASSALRISPAADASDVEIEQALAVINKTAFRLKTK